VVNSLSRSVLQQERNFKKKNLTQNKKQSSTHTQFRYIQEEKITTVSLLPSTSTKPIQKKEEHEDHREKRSPLLLSPCLCFNKTQFVKLQKKEDKEHTHKNTQFSLPKKEERERERDEMRAPCLDATSPGFKKDTMQA